MAPKRVSKETVPHPPLTRPTWDKYCKGEYGCKSRSRSRFLGGQIFLDHFSARFWILPLGVTQNLALQLGKFKLAAITLNLRLGNGLDRRWGN